MASDAVPQEAAGNPYADLILEAATRLYLSRGAARVGMRDIAREAGVAVGTLYNYYRDKADLARAVQERAAEALIRRLRLERLNPGRALGDQLLALVDAALEAAPLFSEAEQLAELMTPAFTWLLEEAQLRGDLPRAGEATAALANMLAAVVAGTGSVLPADDPARRDLPLRLARLVSAGLSGVFAPEAGEG